MRQEKAPSSDMIKGISFSIKQPKLFCSLMEKAGGYPYEPWRIVKYHAPKEVDPKTWWQLLLIKRNPQPVGELVAGSGLPFTLSMPPLLLKGLHEVDTSIGFAFQTDEPCHGLKAEGLRGFLQRSQSEEAISSSQLEGALTTSALAREMIASKGEPKNKSEQMIMNNFQTMQALSEWKKEPLTLSLLKRIHSILTDRVLPEERQGTLRTIEDQIVVRRHFEVVHTPPSAEKLENRLGKIFQFANEENNGSFFHPVVKAILLHFMIGYEHPFVDGNGRTARALFYWYLLRHEPRYWLIPYLSISSVLKRKGWSTRYGQSYLDVENDQFDCTYFVLFQIEVLLQAIAGFHEYVDRIQREGKEELQDLPPSLNPRQVDLLGHLKRHPDAVYTADTHCHWHNITPNTARKDLAILEKMGYLTRIMRGKKMTYVGRKEQK